MSSILDFFGGIRKSYTPSSRSAAVAVMQASQIWRRNDLSLGRRFNFPGNRGVPLQGQMWPRFVVIDEVFPENPVQMFLAQYNHMVHSIFHASCDHTVI